ncbi:MAG: hypothetical protein ABJ360_08520, partial [Roseobacter sp.]
MAAVKRSFRAESLMRVHAESSNDAVLTEERRHQEVMAEIGAVKALLAKGVPAASQEPALDAEAMSQKMMSEFRKELSEAAKLKTEIDAMYEAIAQ